MDIKARIAQEKAALEAIEGKFTPDVEAELADRAELEATRAKREERERALRDLSLSQREDAAREALGAKAKIATVAIQDYPDTFVIVHDQIAYKAYQAALQSGVNGKKVDAPAANLKLAIAVVYDWNGITDWSSMVPNGKGGETTAGAALAAYLTENTGLVGPIVNEEGRLAGSYKEERKSGR